VKLISLLHLVPSLGISGAKQGDNFTFSIADKRRGCKDILTVEGPVVAIYVTVDTMSTAVYNPFVTSGKYMSHLQRVFSSPLG
jgi:hypothetical protein